MKDSPTAFWEREAIAAESGSRAPSASGGSAYSALTSGGLTGETWKSTRAAISTPEGRW